MVVVDGIIKKEGTGRGEERRERRGEREGKESEKEMHIY
jgi:hypothetical protein